MLYIFAGFLYELTHSIITTNCLFYCDTTRPATSSMVVLFEMDTCHAQSGGAAKEVYSVHTRQPPDMKDTILLFCQILILLYVHMNSIGPI